jgi:hypothetical protein
MAEGGWPRERGPRGAPHLPRQALRVRRRHRSLAVSGVAQLPHLGFGRIAASEIEAPNMLGNLV